MGYGFCLENNPADCITLKLNVSQAPFAAARMALLDQQGTNMTMASSGNLCPSRYHSASLLSPLIPLYCGP